MGENDGHILVRLDALLELSNVLSDMSDLESLGDSNAQVSRESGPDSYDCLVSAVNALPEHSDDTFKIQDLQFLRDYIARRSAELTAGFKEAAYALDEDPVESTIVSLELIASGMKDGSVWHDGLDPDADLDAINTKAGQTFKTQKHFSVALTKRLNAADTAYTSLKETCVRYGLLERIQKRWEARFLAATKLGNIMVSEACLLQILTKKAPEREKINEIADEMNNMSDNELQCSDLLPCLYKLVAKASSAAG